MAFLGDNVLRISMVFQGMTQAEAEKVWAPFLRWIWARKEYTFVKSFQVLALPARHFWDADFFRRHAPDMVVQDDRPGAPRDHILWAGDQGQVGWFLNAYKSAWLPATLLDDKHRSLADALFACSRQWDVELHFNKGLAGAQTGAIDRARDTATHPQVLDAFALALIGAPADPAYPGMPGAHIDTAKAQRDAASVGNAMDELLKVAPHAGAYVSESDYFQPDWQTAFWGTHYPRLAAVKRQYDPDGLFFVHHGVGSEAWSADGFMRLHGG